MTAARDLLPPRKSSSWTRALAAAMSDDLPVPIIEAMDPATAPVDLLPWLAVHDGVRLWYSDWSEARKRRVIAEAPLAAFEVGTRAAVIRFLGYVDATLVDVVAYPARFVMGRARIGRTPIGHPAFLARYLVHVPTTTRRAFVIGRSSMASRDQIVAAVPHLVVTASGEALHGRRIVTPDREPLRRCLAAIRAAKAPETEIRVDFGHRRRLALVDAVSLGDAAALGEFVDRTKL